jgi:hypothetical protein
LTQFVTQVSEENITVKTETLKDVMCGNVKYEYLHYVDVWECKIWILALCWCVGM